MKLALWFIPILAFGQAQNYTTFTFDPPGSTNTVVTGINNAGVIIGSYLDAAGKAHNYIRSADGATYTSIDVPSAIPGTTTTDGINNLSQIVGTYMDSNGIHGYVRSADGQTYTTLEPTLGPKAINDIGDIAGQIVPSGLVAQAFVRTFNGQVTMLPGWTYASGINNAGDVVGYMHTGTGGVELGYLRHADGSMVSIQVPGTDGRTRPYSINNHGQIAGDVLDGHVFIRNADGTYANFDLLGVTQTSFAAIEDSGRAVANSFDTVSNRYHGLLAVPTGIFTRPTIRTWSGVLSASGYGGMTTIAPGTWIEIYGQNLSPVTREWRTADFRGNMAPTSFEGVSVRINGQPAYISYISPTQINALVPAGVTTGTATIVVSDSAGYQVTVNALTPGSLVSPLLNITTRNLRAYFPDWTPVGPDHRAKAGDTIVLLGIGFGPVTPDIPVGQIVQPLNQLQSNATVTIGGLSANLTYAGLQPGSVGLYQFNVVVPQGTPTGDNVAVTVRTNDVTLPPSSQVYYTSIGQ